MVKHTLQVECVVGEETRKTHATPGDKAINPSRFSNLCLIRNTVVNRRARGSKRIAFLTIFSDERQLQCLCLSEQEVDLTPNAQTRFAPQSKQEGG